MKNTVDSTIKVLAFLVLNLVRLLIYPFSFVFRIISLWVVLVSVLMAVWLSIGGGLVLGTYISTFFCDLPLAIKFLIQGTGVISLLIMSIAKKSWESVQSIVSEINMFYLFPFPSWYIREAFEDTIDNFDVKDTFYECLEESATLGALSFLIVMSFAIANSHPDPDQTGHCVVALEQVRGWLTN